MINEFGVAETWDKIYEAYANADFKSYDFSSVKSALIEYLRVQYPENFNDFTESSELIMLIEVFAYVADMLSYRMDMLSQENFIGLAERKQSILRLAKLISYNPKRNIGARGLTKITGIATTENIKDTFGNSLSGRVVQWNNPNNPLWKNQFFTIMNSIMTSEFGSPLKNRQVDTMSFELYTLNNQIGDFPNNIIRKTLNANNETYNIELTSADLNESGIIEAWRKQNDQFNIVYSNDSQGDSSDNTGFFIPIREGVLSRLNFTFNESIVNRILEVNLTKINDSDIWINQLENDQQVPWEKVESITGSNLFFNNLKNKNKYEVETMEGDRIRILFGDGDFANIPVGSFDFYLRQSSGKPVVILKSLIQNQTFSFKYLSSLGNIETATVYYSLVEHIQGGAYSESIDRIRQMAPKTYYAQNRMVNGEDYNTLLLRDQSVIKLKSVNRTFAGQSRYSNIKDASGANTTVSLFGDDLALYQDAQLDSLAKTESSRTLIDNVLEPMILSKAGLQNRIFRDRYYSSGVNLIGAVSGVRSKFTEAEKNDIQGHLDRHFYGEPEGYVTLADPSIGIDIQYAIVNSEDAKIWDVDFPLVIREASSYRIVNQNGSGYQNTHVVQSVFGLKFIPYSEPTHSATITATTSSLAGFHDEVLTIECVKISDSFTFKISSNVSGFISDVEVPRLSSKVFEYRNRNVIITLNGTSSYSIGDAFIIDITQTGPSVRSFVFNSAIKSCINLFGKWTVVVPTNAGNENDLPNDWHLKIKRETPLSSNVVTSWTLTSKQLKTKIYSPTTKFWYDSNSSLIAQGTTIATADNIQILKSNLDKDRATPVAKNLYFDVIAQGVNYDNSLAVNSLEVSSLREYQFDTEIIYPNRFTQFFDFVGDSDFVYFKIDNQTGNEIFVPRRTQVAGLKVSQLPFTDNIVNVDGIKYVRKPGRENLDFQWMHFVPNLNVIDPSITNIIDSYVITSGYYESVKRFINREISTLPDAPSSRDLKSNYADILKNKMMSDEVIMHSGKIKLIFGKLAKPEYRAQIKIMKRPGISISDAKLKKEVIRIVNEYFDIEQWDFGQTFYATDLISELHAQLNEFITTALVVPVMENNTFGSLFRIDANFDEILLACPDDEDVAIVENIDSFTIKQSRIITADYNNPIEPPAEYLNPQFVSFGITGVNDVFTVGQTLNGGAKLFSWSTTNSVNVQSDSINIYDITNGIALGTSLPNSGSASLPIDPITKTTAGSHTWRITGTNTQGQNFTKEFSVNWRYRLYFGESSSEVLDMNNVINLRANENISSPIGTYSFQSGGYKWICYPVSLGLRSTFKDNQTNFDIAMAAPMVLTVTDEFGITTDYYCHRTYYELGGSITIRVA